MNSILPALGPFCFLRHGESDSNVRGVVAGWTDVALTERGRQQAREAAERMESSGITRLYSSHLIRARETAEIIAGRLQLDVEILPDLAERNWGILEGRPPERRPYLDAPPGGESAETFVRRVFAALAHAAAPGVGFPLIVSHAGTFRVIREALLDGIQLPRLANCHPLRLTPGPDGTVWVADEL